MNTPRKPSRFGLPLVLLLLLGALLLLAVAASQAGEPFNGNKPPPIPGVPGPVIVDPVAHVLTADVEDGQCTWRDEHIYPGQTLVLACIQYGRARPAIWQVETGLFEIEARLIDSGATPGSSVSPGHPSVRWAAFEVRASGPTGLPLSSLEIRVFDGG